MTSADIRFDDLLAIHRARGPQSVVCWREDGREVPLSEFEGLIGGAADWLRAHGVARGDRIAVMMLNRVEWLAILFAAARIGAAVAVVNTRYRAGEVHHILKSSGAKLFVLQHDGQKPDFLSIVAEVPGDDLPALEAFAIVGENPPGTLLGRPCHALAVTPRAPGPDAESAPSDPVILFTTSGTTSLPKLVAHAQKTIGLHAVATRETLRFEELPPRGYLAALPFCGVFGLNPAMAAIGFGVPVQLVTLFDAALAARLIRERELSHMVGSDEMYRRIFEHDAAVLPTMTLCGFGAFTPGCAEVLETAAAAGAPLVGVYGSSEVNAIFAIQPPHLPVAERLRGGGMTAVLDEPRVRIVHPDTGADCAAGETGHLHIAARSNFIGYFANPEATAKAVDDEGFFNTGDMAYRREDGSFVYVARTGDAIRLSGFLTDPGEIEEALKVHGGLREVQVIGVEIDGQPRAAAFVRRDPDAPLDIAAVMAALKPRIAAYKLPARIWEIEAFPTVPSANGVKIQRTALRQWALARLKEEESAQEGAEA
ncbi:MAG: AMP-binding protein [Pseudochelatococcus sp.]|jgi:fatty-acyl-CoA synthase|uniref:AMP-binding protein n=1 Tax=Pseudochelatococcus sp. TaxID=2020869 RepID=UPI003D8E56C5